MRCDSVKELKGEAFRRLTGVRRSTFEVMAALLGAAKRAQKAAGGKPNTLCIEDQLLDDARILAGIPDLFSYRANLRDQRKRGVPQHQMM
jgi:hypothetical protein